MKAIKDLRCYDHRDRPVMPACNTCQRIALEGKIVRMTAKALLDLGYALQVYDGEESRPAQPVTSLPAILAELMETNDEYLLVFHTTTTADDQTAIDPKCYGWVRFVYGNDGADVISDYTTNLEEDLKAVNDYCQSLL